jgi:uncharacterized protein with beta-barrel porin domain
MALETIFAGTYANDGTGDDLRTAFRKVNANFVALAPAILNGENLGTGLGIFRSIEPTTNTIQFNTVKAGNNVSLALVDGTLTISSSGGVLENLENDLNLNSNSIVGTGTVNIEGSVTTTGVIEAGDVQSTVWGIDVRNLYLLVLLLSGQDVEFGSFNVPTQGTLDMGSFMEPYGIGYDFGTYSVAPPDPNAYDFGTF